MRSAQLTGTVTVKSKPTQAGVRDITGTEQPSAAAEGGAWGHRVWASRRTVRVVVRVGISLFSFVVFNVLAGRNSFGRILQRELFDV